MFDDQHKKGEKSQRVFLSTIKTTDFFVDYRKQNK